MDKTNLLERIKEIVEKNWEDHESAILTSNLGVKLLEDGVNYREILEGVSISDFIRAHPNEIGLISHKLHKAKVGLVPAGMQYSFPDSEDGGAEFESVGEASHSPNIEALKQSRGALYSFIRALSQLPDDEIDSVVIPTRVLVRLLEGK